MTTATATAPYPAPDIAAAIARALAAARDRPQPGPDGNRTATKYAGMAQDFRAGAWEHLDKGDLPQASNKAWGLVAETVKAISAHHGGIIHTHRGIVSVANELFRLVGNAGDTETRDWISGIFLTARSLHSNFYENEAPGERGPRRSRLVRAALSAALRAVLPRRPQPLAPSRPTRCYCRQSAHWCIMRHALTAKQPRICVALRAHGAILRC